jgi:hypothetical protein
LRRSHRRTDRCALPREGRAGDCSSHTSRTIRRGCFTAVCFLRSRQSLLFKTWMCSFLRRRQYMNPFLSVVGGYAVTFPSYFTRILT